MKPKKKTKLTKNAGQSLVVKTKVRAGAVDPIC